MKKHIVCFGDSNTHGYCADPADCADGGIRFNESERWTRRLQRALGEEYLVIEEGLSGRTTCFDDPIHEGLNGLNYIYPCLKSHEDVDLLVIMLGTNDTKDRFYASAACIGIGMARLVKKAEARLKTLAFHICKVILRMESLILKRFATLFLQTKTSRLYLSNVQKDISTAPRLPLTKSERYASLYTRFRMPTLL